MSSASAPRKYAEKEAFVTGHDGTTPLEIFLLCLAVPIGLRLYSKLASSSCVGHANKRYNWTEIAIEFATLVLPNLLLQTSLLPYITGPIMLHVFMLVLSYILPTNHKQSTDDDQTNNTNMIINRPAFLTVHRATIYIQTAIAILAVDFPIFPRRYCKTEVGGYGWMDLGAASFIIMAGWSSSSSATTSSSDNASNTNLSTIKSMKKAIVKCTPLFLLGIIRLITIKGVEYQEHVSEYGVHWNFFFTLCFVEGSMVVWKYIKSRCVPFTLPLDGILACSLMLTYQLYLSIIGGQDFIENGSRQCSSSDDDSTSWSSLCNVFVANREGILGIVGYLSLRLLSESMARYCIWPTVDPSTITKLRQRRLFMASMAFWTVHFFLTSILGVPNSRRSTNVPFILWSMAQNTSVLCLIHVAMTSGGESAPSAPRIFNSINKFGLPFFFVSNILTGLVNLLLDTIHASNAKAMLVLSVYLMVVCALPLLLDKIFDKKKLL